MQIEWFNSVIRKVGVGLVFVCGTAGIQKRTAEGESKFSATDCNLGRWNQSLPKSCVHAGSRVSTFAGPAVAPFSPLTRGTPRFFAAGGLEFTAKDPLWSPFSRGTKMNSQGPDRRSGFLRPKVRGLSPLARGTTGGVLRTNEDPCRKKRGEAFSKLQFPWRRGTNVESPKPAEAGCPEVVELCLTSRTTAGLN